METNAKTTVQTTVSLHGAGPALNIVGKHEQDARHQHQQKQESGGCHVVATSPARVPLAGSGHDDMVRRVTVSEYKQAALCLAEAFKDDEVARYFTHTSDREHWSEAQKWKLHLEVMEYITYAHILKGLVLTIGPDYGCVALWLPPGQHIDDYMTLLRSGLWRLLYKLSAEGRTRMFDEFFPLLDRTMAEVFANGDAEPWYLVYIGTKATARGKGYARKLIEYVTSTADLEGKACYLESSNAINPIIYRKLGFEVVKKIRLAGATMHELDIMVREPMGGKKTSPGPLEKVDSMFADNLPQLSVTTKIQSAKTAPHAKLDRV